MSISFTGKLNEAAKEFPNNSGVNFLIRIGVQEFDYKLKEKVWVNYSGFVFCSNENQKQFYRDSLTEGAIVELKGIGVIPEVYGDQNRVTLKVQNPTIGYIGMPFQNAPSPQRAPAQQAPQQAAPPAQRQPQQAPVNNYQQQAPQNNAGGGFSDFDEDIPFANYELKYA